MQISTLLIVESPTIANIIDGFRLPGVEVAATAGYSWKPKPDFRKGTLKGIASPELLPVRNRIRLAASRAYRIILAADTDPSGEFIAACLAGELKNKQLYRGYLNLLSPSGVSLCMEKALPYKHGATHALLNRLYLSSKLLPGLSPFFSRSARSYPPGNGNSPLSVVLGKLALYPFFFTERNFTRFESGRRYFTSANPVPAVHGVEIETGILSGKQAFYHIYRPWNTGKFISNYNKSGYQGGQFTRVQEILNKLFTTVPEETGSGLITYPRTHSAGFYRATWQQEYERLIHHNPAEAILPVSLWSITPDETAHEGLRPLTMEITPPDIRPLVRKDIFEAYSLLYDATTAAFRAPVKSNSPVYSDKKGSIFTIELHQNNNGKNLSSDDSSEFYKRALQLAPVSSSDDLVEYLSLHALMPASAIGLTLDTLITDGWIRISGNNVLPGSQLEKNPALICNAGEVLHLLQLLGDRLNLAQHPSELDDLIDRMICIANEDINR